MQNSVACCLPQRCIQIDRNELKLKTQFVFVVFSRAVQSKQTASLVHLVHLVRLLRCPFELTTIDFSYLIYFSTRLICINLYIQTIHALFGRLPYSVMLI